jgi:hypothetical protein
MLEPDKHSALLMRAVAIATQGAEDHARVLEELKVTPLVGVNPEDSLELEMERAFSQLEHVAVFEWPGALAAEPAWGPPDMNVLGYPRGQYDEGKANLWRKAQTKALSQCSEEFQANYAILRETLDRRRLGKPGFQGVDLEMGLALTCQAAATSSSRNLVVHNGLIVHFTEATSRPLEGCDSKLLFG